MLRYFTSGESHGEALVAFLSGLPAGLVVDQAFVDRELWRRQQGFGRGGRMKIESDHAHFLSGVHHGKTIGSPIAVLLENRDWQNWKESLPVETGDPEKHKRVASPRPGHADLAGALKYDFTEARYVLERASARESAARVAIGALAKLLLRELGVEVLSHVIAVGAVSIADREIPWEQIEPLSRKNEVLLACADAEAEQRMKEEVENVLRTGDSVGGVFEVVAHNVPPGLGSYVQWDERLDALLAAAVMSLQAVKAVEIGSGIQAAHSPGSAVHDEIGYRSDAGFAGFTRTRNNAGGSGGRRLQRTGNPGSRISEADLHAAASIAVGRFCDARAGESGVRTLGCMRGTRRRRGRRGHGCAHAGAVRAGKIRRRLDERNETKFPRLSGTTEELLIRK